MIRLRSLSGILVWSVLLVGIGHAVEPSIDYRITGVVINSLTGAPVPHCHLSPSLTQQQRRVGRQFPALTESFDADAQGRFSIPLPSAGAWHLIASAPGYVSQAYDQHENFSSAVVLTRSAPSINLVFRLPPEASIGGAVLDEAGEAVRNARVGLLIQQALGPGQRTVPFQVRSFTQTDDRGEYEFANLPPGKYRILVEAKPWYANVSQQRRFPSPSSNQATPTPAPSLDVTYQLTWYPVVNDVAQAETVALNAG